jgi:hypothetical protein
MSPKRKIKLTSETRDLMEDQLQRFREKFGRDPRPEDPMFFDADYDEPTALTPEKMMEGMVDAMRKAGTPPELVYAYVKTGGMMVTEDNRHVWQDEDLAEWNAAIENYFSGKGLH